MNDVELIKCGDKITDNKGIKKMRFKGIKRC